MDYLEKHQDVAQQIAENGRRFVIEHLRMADIKTYWGQLLRRYARLQRFKVELDKTLVEVQPDHDEL